MPSPDDLSLARRVVAEGICERPEVEECLALQHQTEQSGKLETLAELLIQRGFVTRSQLSRLKQTKPPPSVSGEPATLRLGYYELLLKLGEGGMGAVYKANDTRNGKIVAIKVLPRSKARDETFLRRFEMEARATFELDHPNIVHGYDIGHSDGYHYLVIEFVQGYDLCAMLEQRGRFTETEALNILEQMCKALDHIHTEHLVHRDIKPENILVSEDGIAKLTDMGLTIDDPAHGRSHRLTQAGIAMGTPFYLSPEQIKGESDVDIRSDIYALGATTYEMVTGRPPFEGESPTIVMMKHLNETVPSPHDLDRTISINFCHMLERMMAKDPFHRYQTPYEMLQDVRRVIRGKQPLGIRPPAYRSSVARPEMHQQSRRFDGVDFQEELKKEIEARENVARENAAKETVLTSADFVAPTNSAPNPPSSGLLPAAKSDPHRAGSSHKLPGVANPMASKSPSPRPGPVQPGSKASIPAAAKQSAQPGSKSSIPPAQSIASANSSAPQNAPDAPVVSPGSSPANQRIKANDSGVKQRNAGASNQNSSGETHSAARSIAARKPNRPPRNYPFPAWPAWIRYTLIISSVLAVGILIYQFAAPDRAAEARTQKAQAQRTAPAASDSAEK